MIVGESAEALGVVGENFFALESHQIIELRGVGNRFGGLGEGADHGEGGQQMGDAVFADEIGEAAGEF